MVKHASLKFSLILIHILPITNACTTCLVAFSVCLVVLWEGSM